MRRFTTSNLVDTPDPRRSLAYGLLDVASMADRTDRSDPLTLPFVTIIITTLMVGLIMAMVVVMTN